MPVIERNVGGLDRRVRTVLAAVLGVIATASLLTGDRTIGVLAAAGALGFGFNAATGVCGINAALGIDTSRTET